MRHRERSERSVLEHHSAILLQVLNICSLQSFDHIRRFQSLVLLYKCLKSNGPSYILKFFNEREVAYNRRDNTDKIQQPSYQSLYLHNSFTFITSNMWNQLSPYNRSASSVNVFRTHLQDLELILSLTVNVLDINHTIYIMTFVLLDLFYIHFVLSCAYIELFYNLDNIFVCTILYNSKLYNIS